MRLSTSSVETSDACHNNNAQCEDGCCRTAIAVANSILLRNDSNGFCGKFLQCFFLLDLLDATSRGLNGHISCLIASNYVTFRLDE